MRPELSGLWSIPGKIAGARPRAALWGELPLTDSRALPAKVASASTLEKRDVEHFLHAQLTVDFVDDLLKKRSPSFHISCALVFCPDIRLAACPAQERLALVRGCYPRFAVNKELLDGPVSCYPNNVDGIDEAVFCFVWDGVRITPSCASAQ